MLSAADQHANSPPGGNMPPTVVRAPRDHAGRRETVRVVVADDSAFLCRLLAGYLHAESGLQVVGTALDGQRALDLAVRLRPDVLTLDLEMPGLSGIEVLRRVMQVAPTPVVMISGVSRLAADLMCQALQLGAVDFIFKYQPGLAVDPQVLRREIVAKVRSAARIPVIRSLNLPVADTRSTPNGPHSEHRGRDFVQQASSLLSRHSVDARGHGARLAIAATAQRVIAIGASSGGPTALRDLLRQLPTDLDAAVVVIQHLPTNFAPVLVVQLQHQIRLPVSEARSGDRLLPGRVLVAPGDRHLTVNARGCVELSDGPKVSGHRPSIDIAMQSIAERFGPAATGVLLTGMGSDGAQGLTRILSRGGRTFAQTPESCVVASMPQAAIRCGAVQQTASPAGLGLLIQTPRGPDSSTWGTPDGSSLEVPGNRGAISRGELATSTYTQD